MDELSVVSQPIPDEDNLRADGSKCVIRRIICRYGRGCTHIQDLVHRERFWHPDLPPISDEIMLSSFICNECGVAFSSLYALQLHLKRKTAWSNQSLIGCRISCLVDYKEWHEGFVTQYHKSGKHLVDFKLVNERRWLNMKKVAFYIVERPIPTAGSLSEYKSDEEAGEGYNDLFGLAPVEDWVFVEDISLSYAFAQSTLFKIYGSCVQETGHKTKGHLALTDADKDKAKNGQGSLLYGELLPRGANKAFSKSRLAAENATSMFDLGMGTGKIVIQAFLQFKNLTYVYGVELSAGRYSVAEAAALEMVKILGPTNFKVTNIPGKRLVVEEVLGEYGNADYIAKNQAIWETSDDFFCILKFAQLLSNIDTSSIDLTRSSNSRSRFLVLECGDMFDVVDIRNADVVMFETDIPQEMYPNLCKLFSEMKEGSRILTYLDLKKIWHIPSGPLLFRQLEANKYLSDRYPTSWSVQRGHHFFLWLKYIDSAANTNQSNGFLSSTHFDSMKGISSKAPHAPFERFHPSNPCDVTATPSHNNPSIHDSRKRSTRPASSISRSGNCLPFNFDFLSFHLFSRFYRRRDAKDHTIDRSVIPLRDKNTSEENGPPAQTTNSALEKQAQTGISIAPHPAEGEESQTPMKSDSSDRSSGFGVSFSDESGNNVAVRDLRRDELDQSNISNGLMNSLAGKYCGDSSNLSPAIASPIDGDSINIVKQLLNFDIHVTGGESANQSIRGLPVESLKLNREQQDEVVVLHQKSSIETDDGVTTFERQIHLRKDNDDGKNVRDAPVNDKNSCQLS